MTRMESGVTIAITASGLFFLVGLLTGVWKYRAIMSSEDHRAPYYVDICHRSALMYSFACLVLAEFARHSAWSARVDAWAVAVPIVFFALAVASYAAHGWLRDTGNQLAPPHRLGSRTLPGGLVPAFMAALAIGEIGGFTVLFAGYLAAL
jgi:hypothetical protein